MKALSYQDLSPLYMREAQRVWEKHEQPLELQDILDQNFVRDTDGCWRIPDLQAESDLEQLRIRLLLKEFELYRATKGKLTVIRCEALRAGFKDHWQKQDYQGIVEMAKRVPGDSLSPAQPIRSSRSNDAGAGPVRNWNHTTRNVSATCSTPAGI